MRPFAYANKLVLVIACVALLMGHAPAQTFARPPTQDARRTTSEAPCPDSRFTCITLQVPLDHFDPSNPETINVVFGILRAKKNQRKGMFVTATGGPGVSGLLSADSYTDAFAPRIPKSFDIVFFDQRGIGLSGGFQCPDAVAKYYGSDGRTQTPEQEQATLNSARALSQECTGVLASQLGSADKLRFYGTRQAIRDLELFRQHMGDEQFWLYGESYGTQFAQAYSVAFPNRLAGLVLDGTVDLTLRGPRYYQEQTQAFSDVLLMTLQACDADPACAANMGGSAVSAYDAIAAQLNASPVQVSFPLPNGQTAQRPLTFSDLENVAASQLYSEADRMIFLRALAAGSAVGSRGDLVPLLRLAYLALGLNSQTLIAETDPSYSDAAYYAVECNDYNYFRGTPEQRAERYIRLGDQVEAEVPRLQAVFYGDLPCPFWPVPPDTTAFDETPAKQIPTLVLGAEADPATPFKQGVRVWRRLDNAYLIAQQGGPHVIFGRGVACVDDLVTAFLVDGAVPNQRRTNCEGVVADDYVPLPPERAQDFPDVLEALFSAETEIDYLPEHYYWDGVDATSVGCRAGIRLRLRRASGTRASRSTAAPSPRASA
ncbi:MAG: alpha/beta fold hydrolase [Anaerolineae bacterium]|nr:alpha/beta fold hydrolase [Anaerolineae bacterium]